MACFDFDRNSSVNLFKNDVRADDVEVMNCNDIRNNSVNDKLLNMAGLGWGVGFFIVGPV